MCRLKRRYRYVQRTAEQLGGKHRSLAKHLDEGLMEV